MSSSGLPKIPNKLQNIPTNSASYQASEISCESDGISIKSQNITIQGDMQIQGSISLPIGQDIQTDGLTSSDDIVLINNSRITGLQTPISNSEPVTLQYLQNQQQYAQSDISVGTIQIWFSTTIPADYLLCNGQSFNQLTYPELFTILQTNILPDLRDRFIVGANQRALKAIQEQSDPYLPQHSHTYARRDSLTLTYVQKLTQGLVDQPLTFLDNVQLDTLSENIATSQVGGDTTYVNYPRNIAVNFIIKAKSTRAFRNSIQNDMLPTASLIATNTSLLSNVDFNMGGFKITNLSLQAPLLDSDVATKLYVDQTLVGGSLINKLQNGLQTFILQPTELQSTVLLNMQNHKITNLTDPILSQDAVSLNYLQTNNYTKIQSDLRYPSILTTINNLPLATNSLNLNNQKISNLSDPTLTSDAVSLNYLQNNNYTKVQSDLRYPSNLTTINNLPLATNSLNLNNQKIINLQNATQPQDATTLSQNDAKYVFQTTPLQNITLATNNLDLNNQKIINVAQSTLPQDAVIFRMIQQWITGSSTISQIPASSNWVFPFQEINQTSSYGLQYSFISNRFTVTQPGNFDVTILIKATYTNFNQPITFRINSSNGIINRSITTQQPTGNGTLTTSIARFIVPDIVVVPVEFWLEIVSNPSVVTLNDGCYLMAQKLW